MKLSLLALLLALSGTLCATAQDPVTAFTSAMSTTAVVHGPPRGSAAEKESIARFEGFLAHLDEKTARDQTEKVYAPDAFFNDTLKTLHGSPAIRDYYYFRWTMDTRMKHLARGKNVRTIGVTLVRFDPQGRVLIHQDFWDSAQGVWDHVPVIGRVIRWIQSSI